MNIQVLTGGKIVEVLVARAEAMHPDEFRVEITCRYGSNSFKTSHGVQKSGIVSRNISLQPTFWRLWRKHPPPYDAENISPPAGLSPTACILVGSATWNAGLGAPTIPEGKPGDCYLDAGSGDTYKVTRGIIYKLAEDCAINFANSIDVDSKFASLFLPIITPEL